MTSHDVIRAAILKLNITIKTFIIMVKTKSTDDILRLNIFYNHHFPSFDLFSKI